MNKDNSQIVPLKNNYDHAEAMPLVSVVLPVYNRAGCIQQSIKSVLRQTYQNLEIIVVDDGSTDQTIEKIKALSDLRIRVISLPNNKGANAARNVGINAAKGHWIAFQDSDDEWEPHKLQKQVSACHAQQSLVSFSGLIRHINDRVQLVPKPQYRIQPATANRLHEVLSASFISNQTLLVHRDVFSTVGGYDESLQRLQDWELSIRIAEIFPITYVNEPLVAAYVLPDSITNKESICTATQHIIEKHSQLFESDRIALGTQLFNLCVYSLRARRYKKAFKLIFFAIRKCRLQIIQAGCRIAQRL
jgi:glycosyltransferase involved in cell wall biosynthesis